MARKNNPIVNAVYKNLENQHRYTTERVTRLIARYIEDAGTSIIKHSPCSWYTQNRYHRHPSDPPGKYLHNTRLYYSWAEEPPTPGKFENFKWRPGWDDSKGYTWEMIDNVKHGGGKNRSPIWNRLHYEWISNTEAAYRKSIGEWGYYKRGPNKGTPKGPTMYLTFPRWILFYNDVMNNAGTYSYQPKVESAGWGPGTRPYKVFESAARELSSKYSQCGIKTLYKEGV